MGNKTVQTHPWVFIGGSLTSAARCIQCCLGPAPPHAELPEGHAVLWVDPGLRSREGDGPECAGTLLAHRAGATRDEKGQN